MDRSDLPRVFEYPADRAELDSRLLHVEAPDSAVEANVREILRRVREDGFCAVAEYSERFDGARLTERSVRVPSARLKKAWDALPDALKSALRLAKSRVEAFHRRQKREGWSFADEAGFTLTQRIMPLQSVAIHAPGGLAPLPSSLMMAAIPARVAGVKRIVGFTPPLRGRKGNEAILAAAHLCGIHEMYQAGGAHGVAALAYGAGPIPRVEKIVGPGSVWVQTAKRLLFGLIDIDMVAGPTEALIVADETADPRVVAADMLCQAEHAPDTSVWAILIGRFAAAALQDELLRQAQTAPRRDIIARSLRDNGAIVRVARRADAVELANQRAPEHISILARNPEALARGVHSAGAIFLGHWTPESVGDYTAGPNHVLPTGRSARFFSPLGVDDFVRADHMVAMTEAALRAVGPATIAIGEAEGLHAHAEAVRVRLLSKGGRGR
ncbi:MAG: Histidinol dehydrogenase [candidate division BRC1 bacterium ADurb.BinA364]|nr:MAG: Histidinol dehydrogenase [candidate division BRC1 bacterium ADurb.BinA364]